ncbi:MAG: SpoIID/LytB domain-containing protein [Bacteroidota bacterium]
MKRIITCIWLALAWTGLSAQTVRVGLYQDHLIKSAVVYCSKGSFQLDVDGKEVSRLDEGGILYLTLEKEGMKVLDTDQDFGHAQSIELKALNLDSYFRIRPVDPEMESRPYDDDLVVLSGEHGLTLINRVDMDKYLAGVVEAEAGPGAELEFYKAQSILCRTYAMKSLNRHEDENFSLCDGTHCQSYAGKSKFNPQILEGILETSGMILADYNFKLITAAYHSNSGGQTQRASDVWVSDVEYLQSVVDPYSLHQPHAKWRDTISFEDWKNYLLDNGMNSVRKIPDEIIYVEQMRRKKHFVLDKDSLRMTKIREAWGFESSYFDMFPDGDSILIWGKGYGHGVGMSQEGAMKMARDEFSYQDILQFYFFDVRLMDYRDLPGSSQVNVDFDY